MTTSFKKFAEDLCCGGDCGHPEPNNNSLIEGNVFRVGSEKYYEYFRNIREQYKNGELTIESKFDIEMLEGNIGEFAKYEGKNVPLDCPMEEKQDVPLNQPKRGGPKKFYVYVRDPSSGNVKKVTWGDTTGLKAKINNPKARKSFAARHNCDQANDKTKASYWACRLPRYAKQLGMSGGGSFFW